jgi:uncharacterized membrane protein YbhN (UPF0104 family)
MSSQKDMESKVARTWARRTWQRWGRAVLSVAALGVAVATVSSMASHLQLRQSVARLRSADLRLLAAIAPLLLTANLCLKAARFRSLLRTAAGQALPFRQVLASVVLSTGANNLLPLRAGELVRTREIVARGRAIRDVLVAQMVEKMVAMTTLLVWAASALERLVVNGHPGVALFVIGGLLFGLFVGLLWIFGGWIVRAVRQGHFVAFVERGGMTAAVMQALTWSLLGDATEVALIALCLDSLGIHVGLATSAVVFASLNLAMALPSTPGQVGVFEAGAGLGLMMAGLPGEVAVAFALLYRLMLWLPVTLAAGAVWLARKANAGGWSTPVGFTTGARAGSPR